MYHEEGAKHWIGSFYRLCKIHENSYYSYLELSDTIDKEFDIRIEDEEWEKIETVQDLFKVIIFHLQ